jgi:hypothetical protein
LLAVSDINGIAPHAPRCFSFGAFNRDFLARDEGLSMLVLEGRGMADADEFRTAGIGDFELYEFEREARRPDGAPIKVAFTLAFASDRNAPEIGFFTCQHRHPENFWNPALQEHANTAVIVAGVVLVAENPSDHHIFLSAFAGEREMVATSAGISIETPRGEIQAMTPAAFRDRFGTEPPDTSRGARLAALRFAVRDFTAAQRLLASTPGANERIGPVILGPDVAMGATLIFEPN